jgi:hypothetical protein
MLMRDRTAVSNHIRGLLLDFGTATPKEFCHLHQAVPAILDDGKYCLLNREASTYKKDTR